MKMRSICLYINSSFRHFILFLFVGINTILSADACDDTVKYEPYIQAVVREKCEITGVANEVKNPGQASWDYLLSGNFAKSIENASTGIEKNKTYAAYSNAGHSHILRGEWEEAKKAYSSYLLYDADNQAIQDDYRILFGLYPEYNEALLKGLQIWDELFKNFYFSFFSSNTVNQSDNKHLNELIVNLYDARRHNENIRSLDIAFDLYDQLSANKNMHNEKVFAYIEHLINNNTVGTVTYLFDINEKNYLLNRLKIYYEDYNPKKYDKAINKINDYLAKNTKLEPKSSVNLTTIDDCIKKSSIFANIQHRPDGVEWGAIPKDSIIDYLRCQLVDNETHINILKNNVAHDELIEIIKYDYFSYDDAKVSMWWVDSFLNYFLQNLDKKNEKSAILEAMIIRLNISPKQKELYLNSLPLLSADKISELYSQVLMFMLGAEKQEIIDNIKTIKIKNKLYLEGYL